MSESRERQYARLDMQKVIAAEREAAGLPELEYDALVMEARHRLDVQAPPGPPPPRAQTAPVRSEAPPASAATIATVAAEPPAPPSRRERRALAAGFNGPAVGIAAVLPLSAKMLVEPNRTAHGKMWETDIGNIERKPFNDRPWLTRLHAVVMKFRPSELRDEISGASLITLGATMARLWYEGKSVCHHSWSYIAKRSGLCRDTVRRGLKWFRSHGLIVATNVLVRPEGPPGEPQPEEHVANVYLPKLPEDGPPELSLPTPDSPAVKATVVEKIKAELNFIARRCHDAVVTAWGINIVPHGSPSRRKGHHAPA